jgi:hypothetical protein
VVVIEYQQRLVMRVTNYVDIHEAHAAPERLAEERG